MLKLQILIFRRFAIVIVCVTLAAAALVESAPYASAATPARCAGLHEFQGSQ
jgi:hypothetical protein